MATFYLKYRPQRVTDLDLIDVRKALRDILSSGRIPHAFLFAGPRGAGKTSAARILAKAVNCERKTKEQKNKRTEKIEPCNECGQCVAITNGSNLDVVEIDAASNRGVDDMRALRETVKLATAGAAKKVYIIDEAHMLTAEAANALLKTLEEPPEHVLFVLATTVPEKLPETIRSRCTTLVFRKAEIEEIVGSLEKVVQAEGLEATDEAISEIAKGVDGSFREAHKVLEQLSFRQGRIEVGDVRDLLALSGFRPENLLECLAAGQTKEALAEISRVAAGGVNLRIYTSGLIRVLRNVLLSEFGGGEKVGFNAEGFGGQGKVRDAIELFSRAFREIPTASVVQLPLEMAVVEWVGRGGTGPALQDLAQTPGSSARVQPPAHQSEKAELRSQTDSPSHISLSTSNLEENWKKIMQRVKATNHSIEALLRATRPQGFDGNKLVLEVFYQFHKERIEKDPYRAVVEKIAQEVFGEEVRLLCLLSTSGRRAADVSNIAEGVEEDIVRAAEEIFGNGSDQMPN